jgi:hypothetical protein
MNEVVTQHSSAKPGRVQRTADTDLTVLEPGPTARADVYPGNAGFEDRLEDVTFSLSIAKIGAFQAGIHAGPLSPVPLVLAGCVCTLVLHLTHAPEWAQLSGLVLPWAIALSWVIIRMLSSRHGHGPQREGRV